MLSPLRRKRQDAELRIFDVAQKTGIPQSRLSMLERDLVPPKPNEVLTLSTVFETDAACLFPRLWEMDRGGEK